MLIGERLECSNRHELDEAHMPGMIHREPPKVDDLIVVPASEPEWAPLLANVALQLFSYHAAVALGRDVDQPRNLAKSVTVE